MVDHTNKIDVLDHGFARVVNSNGFENGDLHIVRNARACYDAEWRVAVDGKSDEGLINYLMKNRHTSPFEAVNFTFEIKCPIFVARQWMRHRTWSYNEVSARYTELPNEMFLPDPDNVGVQSKDNKQMRTTDGVNEDEFNRRLDVDYMAKHHKACYQMYEHLLKNGWPRELARGVLPLNIYTRFFGTVDVHNLFHFLTLRLHEHAQPEIRVYAEAMLSLIEPHVPVSCAAYKTHTLGLKN